MRGVPTIKKVKIPKVKSDLPKLGGVRVKTGLPSIKGLKKY